MIKVTIKFPYRYEDVKQVIKAYTKDVDVEQFPRIGEYIHMKHDILHYRLKVVSIDHFPFQTRRSIITTEPFKNKIT